MIHIRIHILVDYSNVMKKTVARNFYIRVMSSIISLSENLNAYSNAFPYQVLECRCFLQKWKELVTANSSRSFLKTLQILLDKIPHLLNLVEDWAPPKWGKITPLTSKQIEYLVNKFNDGIKNTIRWKPEAVTAEMEHLKDKGTFVFSTTKFLKPNQIHSYFSTLKSSQQKKT